jgi:hypothetical protein
MAFQKISTDVHVCHNKDEVLQLARDLDQYGGTIGEREEREQHKKWLKEKILGGDVLPFQWAIGSIPNQNFMQRVNGQHSSHVFLELSEEDWQRVRFPLEIVWYVFSCDSQDDFGVLFEQFDNTKSSRSRADKVGAHLGFYPSLMAALDRHVAVKLTSGLVWYREHVENKMHQPERQFQILHENHDVHTFLTFAGGFLHPKKTTELLSPPIIAAMFHTTRRGVSTDGDFWKQLSGGIALLDAGTPQGKLAFFLDLLNTKTCQWPTSVTRQLGGRRHPSDHDVFATCLRAFVTWRKQINVGEIFISAKKKPVADIVQEFYPLPPETMAA